MVDISIKPVSKILKSLQEQLALNIRIVFALRVFIFYFCFFMRKIVSELGSNR